MDSEPIRIALIGAGRMGRVHLGAIEASAGATLTSVVEPRAEVREELSRRGIVTYRGVEGLLAGDAPDAVLIAAPSDRHRQLVEVFTAAGVPMLCEKPLGMRAREVAEAVQDAREANVQLQIGYWRRFVPALGELRRRIADGAFGEISQLLCCQWDAEPPTDEFRAHSGGISTDMGVHEFDQVRWLLAQEFEWVLAAPAGARGADPVDPDGATVLAGLSGGTAAVISLGRHFPEADACWVEVWGTAGHERLAFMQGADSERVFADAMRRQVDAFAHALRGGPVIGAGGEDALAALAIAEQAAACLAGPGVPATRVLRRSALGKERSELADGRARRSGGEGGGLQP